MEATTINWQLRLLALALMLCALGLLAGVERSSATVLCKSGTNPCPSGTYGTGTVIEASMKSAKSTLHPPFGEISCSQSNFKGEVTNPGGEAADVTGTVSTLSFGSCNATVTVLKKGNFTIKSTGGGSGTLVLEGIETTVAYLGLHCVFSGPVSIPLTGGAPASIRPSGTMTRTGGSSGAFCGLTENPVRWTVNYAVTSPEPLFVVEKEVTSAVLCKTAASPCTSAYSKGTMIEASLKAGTKSVLDAAIGELACEKSTIKGEVTNPGGEGADVSGTVSALTFGECNAAISILNKGTFKIRSPSEGNGTLVLEGFEATIEYKGFHCIFSGSPSFSLKGGAMASTSTTSTLSRTGGKSESFCGNFAQLTAEYTVTEPEPLYVVEKEVTSAVLCKTATDPCTGGTYGKGTMIEASLKSGTSLHPPFGTISCSKSPIEGEVTNPGGEGSGVTGTITGWSFGECSTTVTLLKKGTFTIKLPSEGSGMLMLEGFEITTTYLGFHCIWSGRSSIPLNGGSMASAGPSSTMNLSGGGSGPFCSGGAAPQWTVDYTVTAPEPFYIAEN